MKIIVFLFSLYLLALPGITCAETIGCTSEIQNSITKTDGGQEHQDDDCGSFCTCTCCVHVLTVNQFSPQLTAANMYVTQRNYFFYSNVSIPSNYFGNIWQPPRIS